MYQYRHVQVQLSGEFRAAIPHFHTRGGWRALNIGSVKAYCGGELMHPLGMQRRADESYAQPHGCARGRGHAGQPDRPRLEAHAQCELKATERLPEGLADRLPAAYAPGGRLF
jgi:hypothetical protein